MGASLLGCASAPDAAPPPAPEVAPRAPASVIQARCDGGDQGACADLGLRHLRGDGVPLDVARATALLEGACAAKVARGCAYLAGRLAAEQQYDRAFTLAERACAEGSHVGCHHLGEHYERGLGSTTRNPARALALHDQACRGGVLPACASAASLHERGSGGKVDEPRAEAAYAKACDGGLTTACAPRARLIALRGHALHEPARALPIASAACASGSSHACGTVGLVSLYSTPADAGALAQVERACREGHHAFCLELAVLMADGRLPDDVPRRLTLLRTACDAGWMDACARLVGD
ncbi:MAG: sel1 repeat family protein [Deltaproteobacteria bacterium]|nr:sel1 repeat family protein [Deltaproteobacteria bacterium]